VLTAEAEPGEAVVTSVVPSSQGAGDATTPASVIDAAPASQNGEPGAGVAAAGAAPGAEPSTAPAVTPE